MNPSAKALIIFLSLSGTSSAFQFPFKLPWGQTESPKSITTPEVQLSVNGTQPLRIAIVGAGAGGSSAAFWLAKAKERFGYDYEVDVYEKSNYIGGRSTVVHPYSDKNLTALEVGASIFIKANKNLMRAAREFEFELVDFDKKEHSDFGVYDGEKFVVTNVNNGLWKWWYNLRLWWKFGYEGPKKTKDLSLEVINGVNTLYYPGKPFHSIEDISSALNFTRLTAMTASELLDLEGVSKAFSREIVEAATRVNYAQAGAFLTLPSSYLRDENNQQNLDKIHALEGLISMASSGAYSVKGGNYQIFEEFIKRSGATINLNTEVAKLTKDLESPTPRWILELKFPGVGTTHKTYDHVILTAPGPSSPPVEYVRLHVTLLTTSSPAPRASFFNKAEGSAIPHTILTTFEGVRQGGKAPDFNSIGYHSGDYVGKDGNKEWAVKIFSMEKKSDEWLENAFGKGKVGWVFRKEWDAYPVLPPVQKYPSLKFDDGFWYPNAMEPWISTMETTTISTRNVVDLLLTEQFGAGICGSGDGVLPLDKDDKEKWDAEEKVWGWDC